LPHRTAIFILGGADHENVDDFDGRECPLMQHFLRPAQNAIVDGYA